MNLTLIRKLSRDYPGGLKRLASECAMSEQNLHMCMSKNRISAEKLEMIARALHVNIDVFFDPFPVSTTGGVITACRIDQAAARDINIGDIKSYEAQIEMLNKRIADKDALIAEKERVIRILSCKDDCVEN